MNRSLRAAVTACAVAGAAMCIVSTAQAQGSLEHCVVKDAKGGVLLNMRSGQIYKFVAENSALMRDVKATGLPHLLGKVSSVTLAPGCKAILYGNGGATWGHMPVTKSGPVGVPAAHVYGVLCQCN